MYNGYLFELIRNPVITEKTNTLMVENKITFVVSEFATKENVKEAVEYIFKVKVKAVNILNRKGKPKNFKGQQVRRSGKKYAIVTLNKGETIELGIGA